MLNLMHCNRQIARTARLLLTLALCVVAARHTFGQMPHPPRISGGALFSAGLSTDGTVWTWGDNAYAQLGRGPNGTTNPGQVMFVSNITDMTCGAYHTLAVTSAGTVKSWGRNDSGQLGIGGNLAQWYPQTALGISGASKVAAGETHSLVLLTNGTVLAFGNGLNGRLGLGNTNNQYTPTLIPGLTNVIDISAGMTHSAAVLANGALYVWGNNAQGQLGVSGIGFSSVPIPVTSVNATASVAKVACGYQGTLCLDTAGAIREWGILGGTITLPQIAPAPPAVEIDSGLTYRNYLALTVAGSVFAWGQDCWGIMGSTTCANVAVPVQIAAAGSNNLSVACGGMHALALTNAGTVQAWGANGSGQLGYWTSTGTTSNPAPVPGVNLALYGLYLVPAGAYTNLQLQDGTPSSSYANLCTAVPQTSSTTGLIYLGGLWLTFADVLAWSNLIHAGNPMATGSLNALGAASVTLPIPNSALAGLTINAVSFNVLAGNITNTSPVLTHTF